MARDIVYTHGHHESVLRSHRFRTIDNSAAYLSSELTPSTHLLDIGCGPGTITVDFAKRCPNGAITGVDRDQSVLAQAAEHARSASVDNITFCAADIYSLDWPDNSFDVVHAHQVLQHIAEPVAALREMVRVCKPGGVVAARDADYGGFIWTPSDPALQRWLDAYRDLARHNGAEPDAGRHLASWAAVATDHRITATASMWAFSTADERHWWGSLWADRVESSALADQLDQAGVTKSERDEMAAAWRRWASSDGGWFGVPHGEIVIHVE